MCQQAATFISIPFNSLQCLGGQRLRSRRGPELLCVCVVRRYGASGSVNATCTLGAWVSASTCTGEFVQNLYRTCVMAPHTSMSKYSCDWINDQVSH